MREPVELILLASAVLPLAAALAWTSPAAAADVQFHLYGDKHKGWGSSASQLSTPGPNITVDLGDNVTLTLESTDGNQYRWFLDYDDDSARDAEEPQSPSFRTSPVTWNFTANTPGTFTYRSRSDPGVMYGAFIVRNQTGLGGLLPPSLGSFSFVLIVVFVVAVVAVLALVASRPRRTG